MNKENCALKLVDEIILYYDARSKIIKSSINISLKVIFFIKYNNSILTSTHVCIPHRRSKFKIIMG